MVSDYRPEDRMVSRPVPGSVPPPVTQVFMGAVPALTGLAPGAFNIVIGGSSPDDPILRLTERDGCLVITGDEERWDEGAKRFLYQMLQWSGQVGVRWKDEVKRAVEGR